MNQAWVILIAAVSKQALGRQVQWAISVLTRLGFVINGKKSSLVPSQDMVFLGARLSTTANLVCLPLEKAEAIRKLVLSFQVGQHCTAQHWLALLGTMASVLLMVCHARLHMRPIQMFFLPRWNRSTHGLKYRIQVSKEVHGHLQWWTKLENLLSGLPLSPQEPQVVLTTDASSLGWGGVLGEEKGGAVHSQSRDSGVRWNRLGTSISRN